MSIKYLTEAEIPKRRDKRTYNSIYNAFFKPVIEGEAPGISFVAMEYGYSSVESACHSLCAAVKKYRLPLRIMYREGTVFVVKKGEE